MSHAKLSASGSSRWINCTRSVALEALFPEETSEFAEEGTRAHSLAESILNRSLDSNGAITHSCYIQADAGMLQYVQMYVEYCRELYIQAMLKHKDAVAFIEEKLSYGEWVPNGYGTGDFLLITPEKLVIIDLKYGKGVRVDAPGNSQTRLYGLGGINEYGWIYPFTEVEMHIVQPRLNHISVEVMKRDALIEWADTQIRKRARMAYNDCGTFEPGDHCKFCKARAVCKARATHMLDLINNIAKGGIK